MGHRVIELRWTCGECGTRDVAGHLRRCPSCGGLRGRGEMQRAPTPEPRERSVGQGGQGHPDDHGPLEPPAEDWFCRYCACENAGTASACGQCGAVHLPAVTLPRVVGDGDEPPRTRTSPWGMLTVVCLVGAVVFAYLAQAV